MILGLWCLLVLAFAGQLVFSAGIGWSQAMTLSLRDWYPWALLGPATAWLAARFPIERQCLAWSVPVHISACMLAVLMSEFLSRPAGLQPHPFPLDVQPRFRDYRLPAESDPRLQRPPGRPLPEDRLFPEKSPPLFERGPIVNQPPLDRNLPLPPDRAPFLPPQPRAEAFLNRAVAHAKFNIPIYWIIVSIVQAFSYHRRAQEREFRALALENRLAEARLEALRMQLHPHFLFNTLNAIATLVHKDPRAADDMITNLSELLRATLDTTAQEIPLRQELAFLDRYLEIQQTRFGDRLKVEREIEAAALEVPVPTLILQPLVENAIRHGLEPQSGPGVLRISARIENDLLQLGIQDNGAGSKSSDAARPEGIGLANTRERLAQLYGTRAKMILTSGAEGGFSIRLELPRGKPAPERA